MATGPTRCYIASVCDRMSDETLVKAGFSRGLLLFAIPGLGIMFRCRANGSPLSLEYGALLALLEFIKSELSREKIEKLLILSSNPNLVFQLGQKEKAAEKPSAFRSLFAELSRKYEINVAYVEPVRNHAYCPAADFPSLPKGTISSLWPGREKWTKLSFKPLQKGIRL